jgi:hypothetical protein
LDGNEGEPNEWHLLLPMYPWMEQMVQSWGQAMAKRRKKDGLPPGFVGEFQKSMKRGKPEKKVSSCEVLYFMFVFKFIIISEY